MAEKKKHKSAGKAVWLTLLGLVGLGLLMAYMLRGMDVAVFNPHGMIAAEELKLIIVMAAVLFGVAVPTIGLLYYFAWKYRDTSDDNAERKDYAEPDAKTSRLFVFSIWAIPFAIMIVLASFMWSATHRLEPQKAIAATAKPLTVQVVALRWKWLFIYPEQKIATVNHVQLPINTPVQFDLTADETPMSSFWIPHLAGMLYAMTGHVNRLNLIADKPGVFPGSSAEINGSGFADMTFKATVGSQQEFDQWVSSVRESGNSLDTAAYKELVKPSEERVLASYSTVDNGLYDAVLEKYMKSNTNHTGH